MPHTISYIEALREQTKRALDIQPDAPEAMKTWGVYVLSGGSNMNLPDDMWNNPGDTLSRLQEAYRTNSVKPMLSDDLEPAEQLLRDGNWDELAKRAREHDSWQQRRSDDESAVLSGEDLEHAARLLDEKDRDVFLQRSRDLNRMADEANSARASIAFDMRYGLGNASLPPSGTLPGEMIELENQLKPMTQEARKRLAAMRYVERVRQKNAFAMLAAIQDDLSDEAKAVVDRAVANGYKLADEDADRFALPQERGGLPDDQKQLAASFLRYCKPIEGQGWWAAFGKRLSDTSFQRRGRRCDPG